MAQTSRGALQTLINSTIYTNVTNDITGDEVNDVCTDLNDSAVNWVTDVETTLSNSNTKIPTSAAVLANKPISTVSLATFAALVAGNNLKTGSAYIVQAAYTDPVWSYSWTVLVIAASGNTVELFAWAYAPTFVNEFVSVNTNADFSSWVFLETKGQLMEIDAAQADNYNTLSLTVFAQNMRVIINMDNYDGNAIKLEGILYRNDIISDAAKIFFDASMLVGSFYYCDFANNIAYPSSPFNISKTVLSADILAGGEFPLLPAPPAGCYWTVLAAQFVYNYGTTTYTGGPVIAIKADTATLQICDTANGLSSTQFVIGQFRFTSPAIDDVQFVAADPLVIDVTSGAAGDGVVDVNVTVQLVAL
jgi:hypothetical protein